MWQWGVMNTLGVLGSTRAIGREGVERLRERGQLGAGGEQAAGGGVGAREELRGAARGHSEAPQRREQRGHEQSGHSTVTLFARLRGRSTSQPRSTAM